MCADQSTTTQQPKRSTTIKYINASVPRVDVPQYAGQRYEITAPDTIDLQEMAALAINGLTEPTDPEADYEIYCRANFRTNPPVIWHSESDIVQAKFMEALPLLRLASGSDQNRHVEQRWMEVIRQMQGPDGLVYLPKVGRPWCKFGTYGKEPPGEHYFSPWFEGRILGAMTIYHLLTGDEQWKQAGKRVADGLYKLAHHEGDKAHFLSHEFGPEGRYTPLDDPADAVHNPASYHAWCIQGLANYGRHVNYEPAIELAGKLFRWVRDDSKHFARDGTFLPEYPTVEHIHFHGHTMVLLGVLDYGLAAGDREAIEFVQRGFEYGMTQGECLLGYFPEWLSFSVSHVSTLEVCELADMIALAIKLSRSGNGDYWDMVDRWVRNLFYESQLRRVERFYWQARKHGVTDIVPVPLPPYHETDRAVERNVGAFGGWLTPNDWLPSVPEDSTYPTIGIMHCCTGNATRALYYIWENILTCRDGKLSVNLLMNRASAWADVNSHIPYGGQVDVKIKQPVELAMRIPEGVDPQDVVVGINDKTAKVAWDGRYAQVGEVQGDDKVTMTFPIREREEWIDVQKRRYRLLLRGNTCVAIDPPGRNVPLFERDYLRREATRWRTTDRFVSDKVIDW